ncbi:TetR family transcriptional regulator [Paenibacillus sp. NEAU-GSW1]|uniref:TetR family transcriptional regulator n=1 Tax=Paenibacillus sp. NEAU-GSW1 TaxID=2682486 RepID=UPI0012E0DDF6|nr:TetR family transcriptional regulator [Paenibacillus sp. NEAU-GSW1]MUT67861.1 TetR family transcriptional regulator [Paenibacillus sp. NEAU-GSW1]
MNSLDNMDIKMRILLTAKKLFAEQGFDGTRVRQICEEASANVALVSYHFGGKENLFCALFENFFPNKEIASVDPNLDPLEGVKLIIREMTLFRTRDPELIRIIKQEITLNSQRTQILKKYIMPMWGMLRYWLEKGKEQGVFRFRSLDTTFISITGILIFLGQEDYWSAAISERPTVQELIEDYTTFIMNALQVQEGGNAG